MMTVVVVAAVVVVVVTAVVIFVFGAVFVDVAMKLTFSEECIRHDFQFLYFHDFKDYFYFFWILKVSM